MKKLLAAVLSVVLLGSMAVSAFAASSPTGKATENTQTAGDTTVITVNPDDIKEGVLDLSEEVEISANKFFTITGLPADTHIIAIFGMTHMSLATPCLFICVEDGTMNLAKSCKGAVLPNDKIAATGITNGQYALNPTLTVTMADVEADHWANSSIGYCRIVGLMYGIADHVFDPDSDVTAAQLYTILARMSGASYAETTGENWADGPIAWANEKGIALPDVAPDEALTREQVVQILYNWFDYTSGISSLGLDPMDWAVTFGILVGDENGSLNEGDKVTRAQMAVIIARADSLNQSMLVLGRID